MGVAGEFERFERCKETEIYLEVAEHSRPSVAGAQALVQSFVNDAVLVDLYLIGCLQPLYHPHQQRQ